MGVRVGGLDRPHNDKLFDFGSEKVDRTDAVISQMDC